MHLRVDNKTFAELAGAVSDQGKYVPVSYWQETVPVAPGAPLDQDLDCDVAIVGGGYTGLSTAYELKTLAPSLDVVLLERAAAGHGASGRNGGFVMPLIGWDLTHVAHKLGEAEAAKAYRLMYDAVAHTKRVIAENRIDCDLEETGYLLLATCPSREKRIREEVALARRLGFDDEWLQGDALREHIRSDAFTGGGFDPHPAVVNPAKLARGLKRMVEAAGVRVFEQTPLEELTDGQPAVLRTPRATVRARIVLLAVNGYGASLGFMKGRILPVHTYIVLTEPLSDADLEATGWGRRRTSLETGRNFIHYFRLTADNRILFGGEDVALYPGGRLRDTHPGIFRRLEARFRAFFPSLRHVKFTHRWGGVLGVTLDMFPAFGVSGRHGSIFHAAGYSGHGVALGNYAGKILAPRILERAGLAGASSRAPEAFFYGHRPVLIPLEPVRFVGLQAYRAALHVQDRWDGA